MALTMSASAIPSTMQPVEDKYRGAVVEDLQLPPAFALPSNEPTARALELAYDRDFSHIPVLGKDRTPLGYLDVSKLVASNPNPEDPVLNHITKFRRREHYTVITPLTPLLELETFLKDNIFAIVTDQSRKFVLAVATLHDLENFTTRRG